MKVWELMAVLAARPAGEEVHIARSESHVYMEVSGADASIMGEVVIYGDGSDDEPEDEDEEDPAPVRTKKR